jgi:hypothetical protein
MKKTVLFLLLFNSSLFLGWVFNNHTAKDISRFAERECYTIYKDNGIPIEGSRFTRRLRVRGKMQPEGQAYADGYALPPLREAKRKGNKQYYTIPPKEAESIELRVDAQNSIEACVSNFFSYSRGQFITLPAEHPLPSRRSAAPGYAISLMLIGISLCSYLWGNPAVLAAAFSPILLLAGLPFFAQHLYELKLSFSSDFFIIILGATLLLGLAYQFRKVSSDIFGVLIQRVDWKRPSGREHYLWALVIIAATAYFYSPMFSHPFRHDEWFYFFTFRGDAHPLLKYIDWQLFLPSDKLMFRPVHHGVLALKMFFFQDNYVWPHIFSFLKHITAALLVFLCLWRIKPHRLAFLFSALFAMLATQVDPVAWPHVDAYIISTIFSLAGTLLFLRTCEGNMSPIQGFSISAALLIVAILTTELAFPIPFLLFAAYWVGFREPGIASAAADKAAWLYFAPYLIWAFLFGLHLYGSYPDFTLSSQSASIGPWKSFYNAILSVLLSFTRLFPLSAKLFTQDKIYIYTGLNTFLILSLITAFLVFRLRTHLKISKNFLLYSSLVFFPWLVTCVARGSFINDLLIDYLPRLITPTHYSYLPNAFLIPAVYSLTIPLLSKVPRISAVGLFVLCLMHGTLSHSMLKEAGKRMMPMKKAYDQLREFVNLHEQKEGFSFKLVNRRMLNGVPFEWYFSSFPETFHGEHINNDSPRYIANYDTETHTLHWCRAEECGARYRPPPAWSIGPMRITKHPDLTDGRGIKFIRIPAKGRFFYSAVSEVTTGEWNGVMGTEFKKEGKSGMPATSINWHEAVEFIERLNEREGTDAYRLPTLEESRAIAAVELSLINNGKKKTPVLNRGEDPTICSWLSESIGPEKYNYPESPRMCTGFTFEGPNRAGHYIDAYPPGYSFINTGIRVVKEINQAKSRRLKGVSLPAE